MKDIIIALVAIAAVIVGAALQYFSVQRTESAKHYQQLRSNAYVDFIKSVAGIAITQKSENHEKEMAFTILLTDAKSRIAIYGDKSVVNAMAQFFREHGALNPPQAYNSFVSLVQTMRKKNYKLAEDISIIKKYEAKEKKGKVAFFTADKILTHD